MFERKDRVGVAQLSALVCTIVLLSGCATIRRAREAQRGENIPAGERTLTTAEAGLSSNSVLTLDESLRLALVWHPAIAQATRDVAAADAQATQAGAARLPVVSGSLGYSEAGSKAQEPGTSDSTRSSRSAGVGLDLLLYDFGKTPAAVKQAIARRTSAEEALRLARSDVAYGVRTAFFNLCRGQELLAVASEAVNQNRLHRDQVQALVEVGRRTRYDLTKAEVDLADAELTLVNARNDVSNARLALNRSMGLAEDPGCRVEPGTPVAFDGEIVELMARAKMGHPSLRMLRAQEFIASCAVDAAIASLYPNLGLRAQYGGSGSGFPLAWSWSASLQSAMSLFNGGANRARIDGAVAELGAARARVSDREQQIWMDLGEALNSLETAERRQHLSDLIARQAQESVDLIDQRYRVGSASAIEVTDARVTLTKALSEQVRSRFDYRSAAAAITHSMGEE